jgi:4-hydroxy-tetrahydrodipicolinate synthase
VRLTQHALDHGVRGLLMLPPFYYKNNSDAGLFASYDQVIQRVGRSDFQLYLYHFPALSGVPITPGLIELLVRAHPGTVAGVKDSSGDGANTRMLIERFPDLAIFPGTETLLLAGLRAGGAGCISASLNVNPRAIRRLYDDFGAGAAGLEAQQDGLDAVRKILQLRAMIPVMKHLIADQLGDPGWSAVMKHLIADQLGDPGWRQVRPPMLPLPDVEAAALESELAALDWHLD